MMRRAAVLYVLQALTCQAQSARISANHRWIASTDHGHLSIASVSGTDSSLPFGSEPVGWQGLWSPSEDTLAVVQNDSVYTLSEKNRWQPVKVFDTEKTASPFGLLFSSDGKQLAISLRVSVPDGADRGSVRIVNLGDGTAKELLTLPDGVILHSWAPDGKGILFWDDPSFSVSGVADGADLYMATVPEGRIRPLGVRTLPHADLSGFSPTGRYLVFTEGSGREAWTQKRISLLDVLSGAKTFLTSNNMVALFPSWSPAGALLAFSAGPDEGALVREGPHARLGHVHIWVMKPDGSESRQLTFDPEYRDERPRWSADGNTIEFCRVNAAGEGSVWRIGAAGGAPEEIGRSFPLEYGMFGFYGYTDWNQAAEAYRKRE
jgi:Tol biopolymer transport system component